MASFCKSRKDIKNHETRKEIYDFIINAVGGKECADEFGVTGVAFEFKFYDNEISMIKSFFMELHKISPDFVLAWNMAFDVVYIIERIMLLGYDPKTIMTDDTYE